MLGDGGVVVRWAPVAAGEDERQAARHLLRRTVGEVVGLDATAVEILQRCRRCGGPHGQPYATVDGRRGPSVSLSHAGGLVVVAVSRGGVGVDLEPADQRLDRHVGAVVLSARERERWEAGGRDPVAVLRAWVRKEALLKATGHGLMVDPRRVELSADEPPSLARWGGPGLRPTLRMVDLDLGPGVVAALARRGRRPIRPDARPAALAATS